VLAEPVEVGVEGLGQRNEPGTEAGTRSLRLRIAEDVVEIGKLQRRFRVSQGLGKHRDNSLAEPDGLFDLPGADLRLGRRRGGHKHDCVGVADERAKPLLPVLARGDAVPVERGREPAKAKRRVDNIREVEVVAAVGDEDVELAGFFRHGLCPGGSLANPGAQTTQSFCRERWAMGGVPARSGLLRCASPKGRETRFPFALKCRLWRGLRSFRRRLE
jgi:hypothetical protein